MWTGTLYGVYANENLELVIEIAVPGRDGGDLDLRVSEDESVVVAMPAKATCPSSLLAMQLSIPITDIHHRWNVHDMRATCHNGLLTMIFPPKPAESVSPQVVPEAPKRRPTPRIDPAALFRNRFRGPN